MIKVNTNTLSSTARAGRTACGFIMIAAAFFPWGRWVVAGLGGLFVVSAWLGYRAAGPSRGCGCD